MGLCLPLHAQLHVSKQPVQCPQGDPVLTAVSLQCPPASVPSDPAQEAWVPSMDLLPHPPSLLRYLETRPTSDKPGGGLCPPLPMDTLHTITSLWVCFVPSLEGFVLLSTILVALTEKITTLTSRSGTLRTSGVHTSSLCELVALTVRCILTRSRHLGGNESSSFLCSLGSRESALKPPIFLSALELLAGGPSHWLGQSLPPSCGP